LGGWGGGGGGWGERERERERERDRADESREVGLEDVIHFAYRMSRTDFIRKTKVNIFCFNFIVSFLKFIKESNYSNHVIVM
jgi:hypothetical protein